MIETLKKAAVLGLVFGVGAATGRFLVPTKTTESKGTSNVEVAKKDVTTDTSKNKHVETKVIENTKPNGDKIKVTTIVENTSTDNKSKSTTDSADAKITSESKETVKSSGVVSLNILAAYDISAKNGLSYGLQATSSVLGPITVGVFGLTNGILGCSVGLSF